MRRATIAFLGLFLAATAAAAPPGTPPGTTIPNQAEVSFTSASGLTTTYSNAVNVLVAPPPSRSTLTLLRADGSGTPTLASTTQCVSGGSTMALPPPYSSNGQALPLSQPLALGTASVVHGGEAVFVDLVDADRNRDASVVDSVELTISALGGDRETLVL
ncbi:MAG TPA: hypothetical protein VNP02_03560, partial [Gammaproteobacteria bacterium]|nr:hypothetical protein [Gammaproteobacteria bacterium]